MRINLNYKWYETEKKQRMYRRRTKNEKKNKRWMENNYNFNAYLNFLFFIFFYGGGERMKRAEAEEL